MMQDIPRLLPGDANVGFTRFSRGLCFTCVKNNLPDARGKIAQGLAPECAFAADTDQFATAGQLLRMAVESRGFKLSGLETTRQAFLDIEQDVPPMVVLHASWGATVS